MENDARVNALHLRFCSKVGGRVASFGLCFVITSLAHAAQPDEDLKQPDPATPAEPEKSVVDAEVLRAEGEKANTRGELRAVMRTSIERVDALEQELAKEKAERESDVAFAHAEAEKAKAKLEVARTEADDVRANEQQARAEAQEKGYTLQALRAGKLLRFGVTAGWGWAVHAPIGKLPQAPRLQVSALGRLPYAAFMPAYWWSSDQRAAYCAAQWSESQASANEVSRHAAQEEARQIVSRFLAETRVFQKAAAGGPINEKELLTRAQKQLHRGISAEHVTLALQAMGSDAAAADARDALESGIATLLYRPARLGYCAAHKLGVFVGRPVAFMATTGGGEDALDRARFSGRHSVEPLMSVGLVLTPNAYVSVLAGMTYSTVELPSGDADGTPEDYRIWSAIFGIGGNLDLATLLLR